jgi:hypothetical protein
MMGAVSRIVSDTLLYPARRVKTTRQTLASRVSTGQMTQKEAVRPVSSCWIQSLASMRSGFRTVAFLVFLSLIPICLLWDACTQDVILSKGTLGLIVHIAKENGFFSLYTGTQPSVCVVWIDFLPSFGCTHRFLTSAHVFVAAPVDFHDRPNYLAWRGSSISQASLRR